MLLNKIATSAFFVRGKSCKCCRSSDFGSPRRISRGVQSNFSWSRWKTDYSKSRAFFRPFSKQSVDIPQDSILKGNLRHCVAGQGNSDDSDLHMRDTGFSICFLGTAGGSPRRDRSMSSTLLRMGGTSFLFDAGEGTQRQLHFTKIPIPSIERIFITHMHADHVMGLPSILIALHVAAKSSLVDTKRQSHKIIRIYGPTGLYDFVTANLMLTCTKLDSLLIEVNELTGATGQRWTQKGRGKQQRLSHPNIKLKTIAASNGVWTIQENEAKTPESVLKLNTRSNMPQLRIQAAEVAHIPGVPTFGFVVSEEELPGNIDAQKALDLGVSPYPGKRYELLRHGFSVLTDDGSREVHPEEVLLPNMKKKARKFVCIGDNFQWSDAMIGIAKSSDVLVHEATLFDDEMKRLGHRGHSSAHMAGEMARKSGTKVLALNHISAKADTDDREKFDTIQLVEEATTALSDESAAVLAAYDFLEIVVPRDGFSESEGTKKET